MASWLSLKQKKKLFPHFEILYSGDYRMSDRFIGRFKNLGALQSYATNADDVDLQYRIKLGLLYHSRIPTLVQKIQRSAIAANGGKVTSIRIKKWAISSH